MPCAALCRSAFYLPRPLPLNHYVADRWGGPTLCLQGALDPLNDARGASRPPPPPSLPGMHCASLPPWLSLRGPPGLPGMHCASLPPWLSLGGPPGLPACLRFSGASVLPPPDWQGPPPLQRSQAAGAVPRIGGPQGKCADCSPLASGGGSRRDRCGLGRASVHEPVLHASLALLTSKQRTCPPPRARTRSGSSLRGSTKQRSITKHSLSACQHSLLHCAGFPAFVSRPYP